MPSQIDEEEACVHYKMSKVAKTKQKKPQVEKLTEYENFHITIIIRCI